MSARERFLFNDIIMNKLHIQRKTGRYCDMRLAVGKRFVWSHSSVMCAISPFISDQCCNCQPKLKYKDFNFNSPLTVRLYKKDFFDCFECLRSLVDIIYGQGVQFVGELHSEHLYNLCKMLNISDILIKFICNRVKCEVNDHQKLQSNDKQEDPAYICNRINFEVKDDQKLQHITKQDDPERDKEQHEQSVTQSTTSKSITPKSKKILRLRSFVMSDFKTLTGKMHSCVGCHYKCYRPSDLLKHLRESGHGTDVCSLCLSKFESQNDLKDHYILHDHPKPFFCTFCDQRFQTRCLLSQHLPRHSKETPYTCNFCQKGFKWKSGLNSHLLIHSNEKKHLCDECGFSTIHAKTLRAHKLMHTGELFRCTFPGCKHTCARKENMKIHLFTHSNDKPFVCEICGHKFTLSKSLKRHALIHSASEMINSCPHCPFKTLRTDNLKSHILRQHNDKTNLNQDKNDLCVLADAASSRRKIENIIPEPIQEIQVCSQYMEVEESHDDKILTNIDL